ncbi:MAG: hypothetical protein WC640_04035 [Candidatus Paceibacterota bacterium]|jgi:DNA-binding PadR family transcriptional regulator
MGPNSLTKSGCRPAKPLSVSAILILQKIAQAGESGILGWSLRDQVAGPDEKTRQAFRYDLDKLERRGLVHTGQQAPSKRVFSITRTGEQYLVRGRVSASTKKPETTESSGGTRRVNRYNRLTPMSSSVDGGLLLPLTSLENWTDFLLKLLDRPELRGKRCSMDRLVELVRSEGQRLGYDTSLLVSSCQQSRAEIIGWAGRAVQDLRRQGKAVSTGSGEGLEIGLTRM